MLFRSLTTSKNLEFARNYNNIINEYQKDIIKCSRELYDIFEDENTQQFHSNRGRKFNFTRLNRSGCTQIFDVKNGEDNKKDLSVMIIVDESGSMEIDKRYLIARDCCIALAEIFSSLEIPLYIMGYTADRRGFNANHTHYIRWTNTLQEGHSLVNINSHENNFDDYSIYYAGEILNQSSTTRKLMIIISDGLPSCEQYYYQEPSSFMNVRREFNVILDKGIYALCIGIGDYLDTDIFTRMYGDNFIYVPEIKNLFNTLSKKIKTIIERDEC